MSFAEIAEPRSRSGNSPAKAWLRALEMTAPIVAHPSRTLPDVIDELAAIHGDAPALLSDRECLSYRALAERMNRYARFALAQGIAKGDAVCLLMPNRPEYLAIWLGIARVGGIASLINTNLTGAALAHCIGLAGARHIVVASELLDTFTAARPHLSAPIKVWVRGDGPHDEAILDVEGFAGTPLSGAELSPLTIADRALHIYTSGTTGLPKAANISHERLLRWSYWFAGLMDTGPDDRMYDCLPMYHSVGGVVAIGAVLVNGGSVVICEKFSARDFWDDIARWDCTLFQYIGELCRYLVNNPPHPRETAHRLRVASGNGLRADVWPEFKRRFGVPEILEFYAATEGNFSLYNVEGRPGAIGRIPSFLAHRFPVALVKFDTGTGAPLRDADGRCIRCGADEAGEAIGEIREDGAGPRSGFEGYTSRADTEKKILRNVFKAGDAWFRTGDLMRQDDKGYFYFVDRVGDTFRWKGENVATSEVAEVLTQCAGIIDANVYGMEIPGFDGRAGMAELVTGEGFDLVALHTHLATSLPGYARPVFLRICREFAVTSTFKHRKAGHRFADYDPSLCADPVYVNDPTSRAFVPLDAAL